MRNSVRACTSFLMRSLFSTRSLSLSTAGEKLCRCLILASIVALFVGNAIGAVAETQGWFARPYQYVVINQDVRGIITEFGRNVGLPVILTDKVSGRVRGDAIDRTKGSSERVTAGHFLNRLSETNGLTWYFDGSILYVSSDQEFSTQVVAVGNLSPDTIVGELKRLSLMDERFSVRAASQAGLMSVSGPPAFIAIVRQLVDVLRPPSVAAGDDPRVRVFRGGAPAEIVRLQNDAVRGQNQPNHNLLQNVSVGGQSNEGGRKGLSAQR
jgi:type II secretory pathway component GspD/PulD (secretin)